VCVRRDTRAGRPPFRRLLIANRGEIAIRIARACRELGIQSVAVYSDADADALHVAAADLAERIGPPSSSASYLDVEAVVAAAERTGAEAVHPGYGFLAESAAFAEAVTARGLAFVGPPAETLRALGDKLGARRTAEALGVPTVPGLTVALDLAPAAAASALAEVGLPAMLKAAAGGGGRGMRRIDRADELAGAVELARREALAAFGDGRLYLERLLDAARHVEVQLLGDRHGQLAVLGERDCSVQRRHQKLVEEAPAPGLDGSLRTALFDSARRLAGAVPFHSAATVEFLVDEGGGHYFLEMNTRLQVEHGVTELVTGLDLVAWQIRIAAGERLPVDVLQAAATGHAIEVRLYAEDPFDGFRPSAGRIGAWRMPDGPGIRLDAGVAGGSRLASEYDPLLAKLMVHAADRRSALARLERALDETVIGGVQTTLPFFHWLVRQPAFATGTHDTRLVRDAWQGGPPPNEAEVALAAAVAIAARADGVPTPVASEQPSSAPGNGDGSAWAQQARLDALRRWPPA